MSCLCCLVCATSFMLSLDVVLFVLSCLCYFVYVVSCCCFVCATLFMLSLDVVLFVLSCFSCCICGVLFVLLCLCCPLECLCLCYSSCASPPLLDL